MQAFHLLGENKGHLLLTEIEVVSELPLRGSKQVGFKCHVPMKVVVFCRVLMPGMEPLLQSFNETEIEVKQLAIEVSILAKMVIAHYREQGLPMLKPNRAFFDILLKACTRWVRCLAEKH